MTVRLEYKGKTYRNVNDMGKDLPMNTSVMIGWYDGAELLLANAAANCYDTNIGGNVETGEPDKIGKKIITHCRDSGHNTVIEHGSATFFKKVPIFVARQDLRARIASFDERSLRYTKIDNNEFGSIQDSINHILKFDRTEEGALTYYIPDYLSNRYISRLEKKDIGAFHFANKMRKDWIYQHENAIEFYSRYTDDELKGMFERMGVEGERVRETMRAELPMGMNTFYVDTRNLWSWYHHSAKRLCLRAQKEIRLIRKQEVRQLAEVFPTVFGDVNMPCFMHQGCPETKTCGLISLDESGKYALAYLKRMEKDMVKS